MNDTDRILVVVTSGKVQPRSVVAALQAIQVKVDVVFAPDFFRAALTDVKGIFAIEVS